MTNTWFQPKTWRLAHGRELTLGPKALVVGILNVTPDSFSDGGAFLAADAAIAQARQVIAEGAAIVDVGGESTRPGARPISAADEQARVMPDLRLSLTICRGAPPMNASMLTCTAIQSGSDCVQLASAKV